MTRASQVYSPWSVVSFFGLAERSALSTVSALITVPNRSACPRISSMSAGPMTPSRKPG